MNTCQKGFISFCEKSNALRLAKGSPALPVGERRSVGVLYAVYRLHNSGNLHISLTISTAYPQPPVNMSKGKQFDAV
jgi:hypothetical protein